MFILHEFDCRSLAVSFPKEYACIFNTFFRFAIFEMMLLLFIDM